MWWCRSTPLRPLALVAMGVVIAVAMVAAQQPSMPDQPTFRSGVGVLPLDVTVLDKDRRPVRGLTAADFHVLIDNDERPVVAFESVVMPDRGHSGARWMQEV